MSFKRCVLIFCGAFATVTLAGANPPAESFVAAQFTNAPSASLLALTGEVASAIREIMGYPYPHTEISYWEAEGKTVWVLEGRGRSGVITAGFVVRAGRLEKMEVLVYRERRGRQVRSRSFTRQFEGALLTEDRQLDRRIDGITGATISVKAMQNLARAALFLQQHANATGNDESESQLKSSKR